MRIELSAFLPNLADWRVGIVSWGVLAPPGSGPGSAAPHNQSGLTGLTCPVNE